MVAKVAIKEATLPLVIMIPFMAPNIAPNAIADDTAMATAHQPSPTPLMIIMDKTPTKATIDPTDRSIPPAIMTKVIPNAIMPV